MNIMLLKYLQYFNLEVYSKVYKEIELIQLIFIYI